jgi:hypothetical protein
MQSPQIDMGTLLDLESYGFGIIVDEGFFLGPSWYAARIASHGGDIPGYAATVYYLPAARFAVITLASRDGAHFVGSAAWALANLAPLPAPGEPPDLAVDPATFDALAGDYRDDFNAGDVAITRDGDTLRIAIPAADEAGVVYDPILQPISPRNFLFSVDGTQLLITFLVDEAGQGEYLRARPFVARRVPAGLPRRRAPVVMDAPAFRRAAREARLPPAIQWRTAAAR